MSEENGEIDELPFDDESYDPCYECTGLGDDYIFTVDGELESYCPQCTFYWGNRDD